MVSRRVSRSSLRSILGSTLAVTLFMVGCGGEDDGEGTLDFFGPQTFSDDFDSGQASGRWGCWEGECAWDVVEVPDSLLPTGGASAGVAAGSPAAATSPGSNFVFQSPDAEAQNLNRGFTCERISSHFEETGTFGFDYYVNTASAVGFQDDNALEVTLVTSTIEDDPDFGPIPIDSEREQLLYLTGTANSRYQVTLPPGYYDFEFCYRRGRTFEIGPDFVQIDNVETCLGTSCLRDIPEGVRCIPEQGQILVPSVGAVPTHLFTLTGSGDDGLSSPYILIINAAILDFFAQDLDPNDPLAMSLLEQIDGVGQDILLDAKTCDTDTRRYVRMQLTEQEIIELILANFEVNEAFIWAYLAVKNGWTGERTFEMIEAFKDQLTDFKTEVLLNIIDEATED